MSADLKSVVDDCHSKRHLSLETLAAEWQTKELDRHAIRAEMMKQEVLQKLSQATGLMDSECKETSTAADHAPINRLDWDELYETSANLMDLYTKEVDICLTELDSYYRKQYLWQEAAFTIDSHRGATRIGFAESWIASKETHLEYTRQELSSSARVIKRTLEDLSRK
ncbi:LAFA_0G13256g1_1 [Lachancea sp. 'fantastica']|nr:LAFA_0G13256g1_1 [Lachancea sp. 'fantastica']